MIEPPPFACAQEEDDEHEALTAASSSDSASHSQILKTPLHKDAQHDPSLAHRVRFINDAEEERSISYAPSPLPFAISPVETATASDKNPADENDDNNSSDAHQQLDSSENVRNSTSSSYYTTSSMNTKTSTQNHDDGNGHAFAAVADSSDGPGITILDESSIYRSSSRSIANSAEPISSSAAAAATSQLGRPTSSSFFQTQIIDDSIIRSAAAHVDANLQYSNVVPSVNQNADGDASSILNQLMQYANDGDDEEEVQTGDYKPRSQRITEEQLSIDDNIDEDDDNETNIFSTVSDDRRRRLWELPKHFLSLLQRKRKKDVSNNSNNVPTAALANPTRSPIRSHRIRHDKYIVEVDIMPTQSSLQSSVNIRDAIDILANIDLLHLWFEPIPSVFDACAKDGSGREVSPQTSPANSISSSGEGNNNDINSGSNNNNIRQYDGEWIEISSSLLALPSDARISRCFSATRVNLRKMIGFPARVRSMMFVERSAGRVGLTLGPFPDRLFHGTMAHHTFHVSVVNVDEDEEIGLGMGLGGIGSRQKIVISDEVRLQREGDDEGGFINGGRKRNGYCYCALFRVLFSIIEWITVLWYQPDLASYMSQTISSMEKLRTLIECGGETGAYASGELVMEAEDWEEGGRGNTSIRSPLLG